jgi:hypothetical protein
MPWMPDKMPYLPNGEPHENENQATSTALNNEVDIKAAEKRILSSTEHLNEILALNALVAVKPSSRYV